MDLLQFEGLRLRCLDESLWLCKSLTFQTVQGSYRFSEFLCFDLPRMLQYQVLLLPLHLHRQMSPSEN